VDPQNTHRCGTCRDSSWVIGSGLPLWTSSECWSISFASMTVPQTGHFSCMLGGRHRRYLLARVRQWGSGSLAEAALGRLDCSAASPELGSPTRRRRRGFERRSRSERPRLDASDRRISSAEGRGPSRGGGRPELDSGSILAAAMEARSITPTGASEGVRPPGPESTSSPSAEARVRESEIRHLSNLPTLSRAPLRSATVEERPRMRSRPQRPRPPEEFIRSAPRQARRCRLSMKS
jgi:hypothetical protein